MSQFDEFLSDASRIGAEIRAGKAQADDAELALRQLQRSEKIIVELKEGSAGNLAMKHLLLRELKKLDPSHPLILDAALHGRGRYRADSPKGGEHDPWRSDPRTAAD